MLNYMNKYAMFKALKISTTALLLTAVAATFAMARGEPWLSKRPKMTDEQLASVQAATAVEQKLPAGQFGFHPEERDWAWKGGVQKRLPVSNIALSELRGLMAGKYRISNSQGLTIQYMGENGVAFNCEIRGSKAHTESVYWNAVQSRFGLGGLAFDRSAAKLNDPKTSGWAIIGDPRSGLVYLYAFDRKVYPRAGWVQTEIPAVAAELCPDLPNNGKVNRAQIKGNFDDLLANSNRVTGFKVAFPNNPQNPMTAEMFYHFYTPSN